MVDPTVDDKTFPKSYIVQAQSEAEAYSKADEMQSKDDISIKHRSIFDYKVDLIN